MNKDSLVIIDAGETAPATPDAEVEPSQSARKRGGGPATPEGKARSARNALKHGEYAVKYSILQTESVDAYRAFLDSYYTRFAPVDEVEKGYVTCLADTEWHLNRISTWETQAVDAQIDALRASPFNPGPEGQIQRSTTALTGALNTPTLPYLARRHSALIRARNATLKALEELRRRHPSVSQSPEFLPDPLNSPSSDAPSVPVATNHPAPPPLPYSRAFIQKVSKRTRRRRES